MLAHAWVKLPGDFATSCKARAWFRLAEMKISEEAVFRWVLIVVGAAVSVVVLTLLTRPLVGALWALVLVIAASVHGYRWVRVWWQKSR